jgi:hypothetical protein
MLPPSGSRGIKSAIPLSKALSQWVWFVDCFKPTKMDVWFAISGEMSYI